MQVELEAQHEKEVEVYQMYLGIGDGLKDLIRVAIEADYLIELTVERVGYFPFLTDLIMTS